MDLVGAGRRARRLGRRARPAATSTSTTAPRLREQVDPAWSPAGSRTSSSTSQAVDFIDSTGLGVLVGLLKRTRTQAATCGSCPRAPACARSSSSPRLDRALPLADTVDAAIAAGHPARG